MKQAIMDAMVRELRRQANEDGPDTPYFDSDTLTDAVIDGRVDLEKLAEAIEDALPSAELLRFVASIAEISHGKIRVEANKLLAKHGLPIVPLSQ